VPDNSIDDADDFVRLLTEHQSSLKAYIISLIPGLPGVNDVLQETNLTLWRKRENFRPGSNFTAWAFAVARFAVLEHRRRLRRDDRLLFSDELTEVLAYSPEELAPEQTTARQTALHTCMEKLSEKHRDLVRLRYDSDTTLEDFARDNGRNSGSLRVILFQIRASLRRCIQLQLSHARATE
jgi:RNA polymerase sigma-70 factor (ECF subfamily)